MGNPFIQQQVTNDSTQFWPGIPQSPDLLLVNLDQNDNITVGPQNVQPNDINGYVITPQDAISLPGDEPWWCVTDSLNPPLMLQVLPGGGNWSAGALAIAGQIAASGLALAIAEEIASQGLSLVASPTLLYGSNNIPTPGGTGLVGVSLIGYNGLQPDTLTNYQAEVSGWNHDVGRNMGTNAMKRYYKYWNDPRNSSGVTEFPSAASDSQKCSIIASQGTKILVSLKPAIDPTGNYNANTIAYKTTTFGQEFTKLVNAVAYLVSVCPHGVEFTLWQEANLDPTNFGSTDTTVAGPNYSKYVNYYGPAFNVPNQTSKQILVYDPVTSQTLKNNQDFWDGGSYAAQLSNLVMDAYASDYTKTGGQTRFADVHSYLVGLINSKGWNGGYWEWGITNGPTVQMTGNNNINFKYWNEHWIIPTLATWPNADCVWYVSGTGQNYPLNSQNGTTAVDEIQKTFDSHTSAPGTGVTIAAGATATLVPNNPSPGAGYAVADGISYDITVNLVSGAGSTNPFATIELNFLNTDDPNAQPVRTIDWSVPCGTAGTTGTVVVGEGPQRGQFMSVNITNRDSVAITVNIQLNSTSRPVAVHDWEWDAKSSVAVPGFTAAGGAGSHTNQLGAINGTSVVNGTPLVLLFGMRAGEAFLRLGGEGGAHLQYVINPYPQGVMGSAALVNESPTVEFEEYIILPRSPILVTVTNNDAASAHNANVQIVHRD